MCQPVHSHLKLLTNAVILSGLESLVDGYFGRRDFCKCGVKTLDQGQIQTKDSLDKNVTKIPFRQLQLNKKWEKTTTTSASFICCFPNETFYFSTNVRLDFPACIYENSLAISMCAGEILLHTFLETSSSFHEFALK